MYHLYGQIFDEAGTKLDPEPGWAAVPAAGRAMMAGRQVFAQIDVADEHADAVRSMMPNFFTYFARNAIEPFNNRWPVDLVFEGTVRAAGGLEVDEQAATGVPGLFAVGDVADKTRLTGAQMSGAGAAIAWCVASGQWAGEAAAGLARAMGAAHASRRWHGLRQIGGVGADGEIRAFERQVQDEILPLEKSLYRHAGG
jgi:succinate dehydrogenase/fumarate reductase flavoprotein subunit